LQVESRDRRTQEVPVPYRCHEQRAPATRYYAFVKIEKFPSSAPDEAEEDDRLWRSSIESGEPFRHESRFRRADGVYRWHLTPRLCHARCGRNRDLDRFEYRHSRPEERRRNPRAAVPRTVL